MRIKEFLFARSNIDRRRDIGIISAPMCFSTHMWMKNVTHLIAQANPWETIHMKSTHFVWN